MKYLLIIIVAVFAASCGGAKSSTSANGSYVLSNRQPKADSEKFPAARLLTLVAMDVDDKFDDAYEDDEIVVFGEVEKTNKDVFHFYGGAGKEIGCLRAESESYAKLQAIFDAKPARRPTVEAIGKYKAGNHDPKAGTTYVSVDDCEILSIRE